MKIIGNEPSNPVEIAIYDGKEMPVQTGNNSYMSTGLSIRQQFAMAAMQGILSNLPQMHIVDALSKVSEQSVLFADALIAELNRTEAGNGTNGN